MKSTNARAAPLVLALLVVASFAGCGDEEERRKERQHLLKEMARVQHEAEQERRRIQQLRERDRRVLNARRTEAESDVAVATLAWAATALALAVVIFLLARENRLRRVVEQVLRTLQGTARRGGPR